MRDRLAGVTDGARCSLATQQQVVVNSLLEKFPAAVDAHLEGAAKAEPVEIAELRDINDGVAQIDTRHAAKQPDWSFDEIRLRPDTRRATRRASRSAATRGVGEERAAFLVRGPGCLRSGGDGDRTHYLLHAMQALYQLSYAPEGLFTIPAGLGGDSH